MRARTLGHLPTPTNPHPRCLGVEESCISSGPQAPRPRPEPLGFRAYALASFSLAFQAAPLGRTTGHVGSSRTPWTGPPSQHCGQRGEDRAAPGAGPPLPARQPVSRPRITPE